MDYCCIFFITLFYSIFVKLVLFKNPRTKNEILYCLSIVVTDTIAEYLHFIYDIIYYYNIKKGENFLK